MCSDCPAEVIALGKRVYAYMKANDWCISGGLHIVIEDGNVADEHITWCQQNAELDDESREIAAALLAMPVPYRHVVVETDWRQALEG